MNNYLNKHTRSIARQILAVFVVSWFSLIGQASAHSFMMLEMQQHKAMGHEVSHCQPVLCETVISLDDQTAYGIASVNLMDFNQLPLVSIDTITQLTISNNSQHLRQYSTAEFDPPPLQKSGILRL